MNRLSHLFGKNEDQKTGVISDKTTVKTMLPPELEKKQEETKKAADETAARVKASTEKPAPAETLPPPELPIVKEGTEETAKPAAPITLPKSDIAPVPKPSEKSADKPVSPPELPKLPALEPPSKPSALPSLTAITGDKKPNSEDVVNPRDAVDSKPLESTAPVTSPLAAPSLPKLAPHDDAVVVPKRQLPDINVNGDDDQPKPTTPSVVKDSKPALPMPPVVKAPSPLPAPSTAKSTESDDTPPPPAAKTTKENTSPVPPPALPKPALSGDEGEKHSLSFAKDKTDLSDNLKSDLNDIADSVKKSQKNVRVVAYASGSAEDASVARRYSLSRALAIRAFLISKGVNPLSISTQALGNQNNTDSADVFVK